MPLCPKCKFEWKSTSRSNPQNRYYWGVVIDILSNELGYTPEEIHEILRQKFLTRKALVKDEEFVIPISTTTLTTVEMENYLTKIREWASLYSGIYIPEPNEESYANSNRTS